MCWREGSSTPVPRCLLGASLSATTPRAHEKLPASPAGDQSSAGHQGYLPPVHAPIPVATQVLHLQDLLLDPRHQDLGASWDFGVGQQDPQRRHPASNETRSNPLPSAKPRSSRAHRASRGFPLSTTKTRVPLIWGKLGRCSSTGWVQTCSSGLQRTTLPAQQTGPTYLLKSVFSK